MSSFHFSAKSFLSCAAVFLCCSDFAFCQTPLSDQSLAKISFEQKLNAQVPAQVTFRDENGQVVRLADYFGKKPVVLVPGYYQCPMLCGLVINGMLESMQDLRWTIGKEFDVVHVSIGPREGPILAAAKKRACLKRYGRDEAAKGWHFLTGDESAIQEVTRAIGFHYAYDELSKQYAHPSGFVVLTPDGKVARYFFGVTYSARDLQTALATASDRSIGSRIHDLVLLCFHYRPITSKYGATIMLAVRSLAAGTLAALAVSFFKMIRKERAVQPCPSRAGEHSTTAS